MNEDTKKLINKMVDNVLEEVALERQFLAVLADPDLSAGDVQKIEHYIEDRLTMHPRRPPTMNIRLDKVSDYVAVRLRMVGWKEMRDDVERQRTALETELASIEYDFCGMLDDDEEDLLIDLMSDDDDGVMTLDEAE